MKLVLQLFVFSLGSWIPLLLIVDMICMFLGINVNGAIAKNTIWLALLISILIQGAIFINRWAKLRRQEDAEELPDMQDMNNITPRQMIFLIIGLPLLIASIVLFQLHSKLAGVLCFIPFLIIWVIDTIYARKRYKKIADAKKGTVKEAGDA